MLGVSVHFVIQLKQLVYLTLRFQTHQGAFHQLDLPSFYGYF